MISAGSPTEYVPYGRELLPVHPKDTGFESILQNSSWICPENETSRDLFRAFKAFSLSEDKPQAKWLLRESERGEEELYFSENTVVWSLSDGRGNSLLLKTFSLENRICGAVWCDFTDEGNVTSCICAHDNTTLEIYSDEGDSYPVTLPFSVQQIHSSQHGLLVERVSGFGENVPIGTSLPLLFSLTHPLKDISPVILKECNRLPHKASYLTTDSKHKLVGLCEGWPIVLMYCKIDGTHSIWTIRAATEEDNQLMNIPSTSFRLGENSATTESPLCSTRFQQSTMSPIAAPNLTKQSIISSPSIAKNQSKSVSASSAPACMSPLRSSRLGGAPASPHLRSFNSPNTSFESPIQSSPKTVTRKMSGMFTGSPFSRLSTTPVALDFEMSDDVNEPIIPEVCFEFMWSETSQSSNCQATKLFTTTDFMGQTYLAYLLQSQQQLRMIRFDYSNDGQRLIFGAPNVISVRDAEPLKNNLLLTLDTSGNLILYSGIHKISAVHVPIVLDIDYSVSGTPLKRKSILHSSFRRKSTLSRPSSSLGSNPKFSIESRNFSPVMGSYDSSRFSSDRSIGSVVDTVSLKNAVGNMVTLEVSEAKQYRLALPNLSASRTVEQCIQCLKAILPKDVSMQLLVKWFSVRNAPGPSEYAEAEEVELFKNYLLELVGYGNEDYKNSSLGGDSSHIKKMKLGANDEGTNDDWEWLLKRNEIVSKLSSTRTTVSSAFFPYLPHILYALHLSYEELKLSTLTWDHSSLLLDLLYLISSSMKLGHYQDHYCRELPSLASRYSNCPTISDSEAQTLITPNFFTEHPPSVYQYLQLLLNEEKSKSFSLFPYIPNATPRIRECVLLFASIRNEDFLDKDFLLPVQTHSKLVCEEFAVSGIHLKEERVVTVMSRLKVTPDLMLSFPPGVLLPLWECLIACRKEPSPHQDDNWYALIGRSDLLNTKAVVKSKRPIPTPSSHCAEADDDGVLLMGKEVLQLLFPDDRRVYEAYNLLQSSKSVKITIQQRAGVSDHDFIEEQERHLYTISIRTMALSIGRGMLTLRTYKPVVAETFPIPKLCLSGRVPPRNTAVELTHIDVPANMNTWPLFHNGVAAGLRASPSASEIIDSSWIVYNRPKSSSSAPNEALNEHAGFLLALGLNGHLSKLSIMNIHDYLCKGNELTRVAILLGLAAARRGTMDVTAVKMLSIHVEALLPPTSTELDVPPVVQVAAVLGIGLLYQNSGHRHIAEVLLGEIGRPPGPEMEHYIDRESYALAAGLAFGLVMLGKGSELISLVSSAESVSMADQLCNYMIGGHKRPLNTVQREKYKTPSYQIREGDYVNADVTSPGATLALGMLFFNTNSDAVAKWVTAPDTQYLLETVRPDFLLLRTLAKGLIMWSRVVPSKEWVDTHMPHVVSVNAFQRQEDFNPRIDYETMSQAYCNIVAGACMTLGLKFAGTANKDAFKVVMSYTRMFLALPNKPQQADQAGRSTIESCLNVLVISLALIMAGTGNVEVMKICRYLRSRTSQVNVVLYGSHMATHMALGLLFLGGCRYTISTAPESVASLLCAFFPKFPIHSNDNRYHLQAFRHLYVLASTGLEERLRAPCLIPELNLIDEIIVDDPRYWKISFRRDKNWNHLRNFLQYSGIMDVKQKVGCLPYKEDPKGYKSVHSQYSMKDAVKGWNYKPESISAFSSDTVTVNFSNLFLTPRAPIKLERQLQQSLCQVLIDCAAQETVDCLPVLTELNKYARTQVDNGTSMAEKRETAAEAPLYSLLLWQLKLAISSAPLCSTLKDHFVEGLRAFVARKVSEIDINELAHYLKGRPKPSQVSALNADVLLMLDLPVGALETAQESGMTFPQLVSNLRQLSLPMHTLVALSTALNDTNI
ncbi:Anaphase-promoting complex subunit 1 [Halotydeus destructor]|nr:Anaphase-promoting complex subunit 1 [Halotydeus destructor]